MVVSLVEILTSKGPPALGVVKFNLQLPFSSTFVVDSLPQLALTEIFSLGVYFPNEPIDNNLEEIAAADYPDIRSYKVVRATSQTP